MKKILLAILILGGLQTVSRAEAATYYVRPDGGTRTQCSGIVDAPYPGAGSGLPCAFNHPFWAIAPVGNNPTKMVGGDTLIIDGSNNAEYKMGLGAPNAVDTSMCHSSWPWNCYMRPVPSGSDPAHPTRILGKGWDTGCANPPQLWGTEKLKHVLNLLGSDNVELQCLDVTDHSACQLGGPVPCSNSSAPYGQWAVNGIAASDSSNVLIKNVNIHGLYRGVYAGRLSDWTLEDSKIVANSFVGWDGDIGGTGSSNSGTMAFNNTKILYNGCGETYPGLQPYKCYSQDQGGYGDGLGTTTTGGNWVFNNVDFSHNVSDGLDLLYHNGNGTVSIKRSRFEGNAGNQVKTKTNTIIENSMIIGNCGYFANNPMTHNPGTFNNCRAGGDVIAFAFHGGKNAKIVNSTVISNGNVMVMSSGSTCSGTEYIDSKNNIFVGGTEWHERSDKSALYYAAGQGGNGGGSCGSIPFNDDYSVIYNTKYFGSDCNNKPHSKCQNPLLVDSAEFYTGNAYNVNLQSGSPARSAALLVAGMSGFDYNMFDRGSEWDSGALEFGSVPGTGTGVCGNNVLEPPEQCDDGNTQDLDGCSSTCTIETPAVCGNGIVEGNEECDDHNLTNLDGCSSLCRIEIPPVCGNNVVEPPEECDDGNTSNLDGCSNSCEIEILGVCGNGVIEGSEQCDDHNTSNNDGCSSACMLEQQTNYQLMLSYSSNRSGAVAFPSLVNGSNIYAFVSPSTGISQVKFYLDDPNQSGSPRQTENGGPWDFAGTASNGNANPYNAGNLSPQSHAITTVVHRTNNTIQVINSSFTVAQAASSVTYEAEAFLSKPVGGLVNQGWNIWGNGEISTPATLVPGQYKIKIIAKGQLAGSALPNMRVKINGTVVGNKSVGATNWTTYYIDNVTISQSSNTVAVGFTNDYRTSTADRNLLIDKVVFIPL